HSYARGRTTQLRDGLQVTIDGRPVPLQVDAGGLDVRKGAGGLETLFLAIDLSAPLPDARPGASSHVRSRDTNLPDRTGWKEVIAVAAPGVEVRDSTVPST